MDDPAHGADTHGALMDGVYRHQRYVYDFTRKYYLFGRDRLIADLRLRPGERVVEVGCGTARNLIRMARRYPDARLYGLDVSQEMLKTARISLDRAGFGARVRLVHGCAETLSPAVFQEQVPFDRVIFSYSLSMIPDWRQALRAAGESLSPDGRIHVVDFGDLAGLGRMGGRLLRGWLSMFHVEPRSEILRVLENTNSINLHRSKDLRILWGRYAFILGCSKDGVRLVTE